MKIIDRMYEDSDVAELRRKILAQNKTRTLEHDLSKISRNRGRSNASKENNYSGVGSNHDKR